MKMSKPGQCCDACFEKIAKRNGAAAKLWLDLCELQFYTDSLLVMENGDEMSGLLRTLELMGFLVTTETQDALILQLQGKKNGDTGSFFCHHRCSEHASDG